MSNETFQPGSQHPDRWRQDLNPDALAGQNYGAAGQHPEQSGRSAYDNKDLQRRLSSQGYSDDELKQIPVLEQGARLEQGATYIDLNNLERGEFSAMGSMEAGPRNAYVHKSEVEYTLWNRLIGVTNPARLDEAAEG